MIFGRSTSWMLGALIAVAGFSEAMAQPSPPAAPLPDMPPTTLPSGTADAVAPPAPAPLKGPSFESGGLKLTVVSSSTGANSITLSLLLENKNSGDVLVSLIGPADAIDNGETYDSSSVGGIATCATHGPELQQIKECLSGAEPKLSEQEFTYIDRGNTIAFNMSFEGPAGGKVDPKQPISLAMTIAIAKAPSTSAQGNETLDSSRAPKGSSTGIPSNLRFISLGIPIIAPPAE